MALVPAGKWRAALDVSMQALRAEISDIESRLQRAQARRVGSAAPAAAVSEGDHAAQTLRERRIGAPTHASGSMHLMVSLAAPATARATRSLETSFFSPSCHDWKHDQLMRSADWTPFTSPRRRADGSRWQRAALGG